MIFLYNWVILGFQVNFPTCMINERNGVVVCLGSTAGFCWGRFSLAKDFHGGILKHDPFLRGIRLDANVWSI